MITNGESSCNNSSTVDPCVPPNLHPSQTVCSVSRLQKSWVGLKLSVDSTNSDNSLLPTEDKLISGDFNPQNKEILKYIDKRIKQLGPDALVQVCNIIKNNMEKYTIKKDYVLLNLGTLKPETIRELVRFVTFIYRNQTLLDHDELLKEQLKAQHNSVMQNN